MALHESGVTRESLDREGGVKGCSPEMAYVVLDDCEVDLRVRSCSDVSSTSNDDEDDSQVVMKEPPSDSIDTSWIEIKILRDEEVSGLSSRDIESGVESTAQDLPLREPEDRLQTERRNESQSEEDAVMAEEPPLCRHCCLEIQQEIDHQGSLRQWSIDWNSILPFHGQTSDIMHQACGGRLKSDAALLLGLVRCNEDLVHIRQCWFRWYDKEDSDGVAPDNKRRGTMIVTLSFPKLDLHGAMGTRYILGRRGKTAWQKPLPVSLQLLLSVVRSDWSNLDQRFLTKQSIREERRERFRMFPPKLSLEVLYQRLPSSANASSMVGRDRIRRTKKWPPNGVSPLLELPEEILLTKLCPFLRAPDLERVRWSCSQLYTTLRAVVPGLKLHLYSHQIQSLCWMRERECRLIRESDCLRSSTHVMSTADGDLHRAATGGMTVLLRERPRRDSESQRNAESLFVRIHQCYGTEVTPTESDDPSSRQLARGGLLCDDPGLGKTITLLSLFLQTYGITTEKANQEEAGASANSDSQSLLEVDSVFQPYWAEITSEFRIPLLCKLLNRLLRSHKGTGVIPPERLVSIRDSIQRDSYLNVSKFEKDVEDAIQYYTPDDDAATGRQQLLVEFRSLLKILKNDQSRSARKAYSNSSGRHKSRVAAVIAKQSQDKFMDQLVPTGATLLVIPHVLMEHWEAQISMHVDLKYLTERIPLIYDFGKVESRGGLTVDEVVRLCLVKKSHAPLVFLDRGTTRTLPSADFLAMFRVVITSTDRFKNEWSKGSFQNELKQADEVDETSIYNTYIKPEASCPLLKVHWLRLVVDEGHSMGRSQSSSTIQFASWIYAQRRWAMTGTPTKNSSELGQLKSLFKFLQHDFFGSRLDGSAWWRNGIFKSWKEGSLSAFFRLQSLLGVLMKRHTKLDIHELKLPIFEQSIVPMSAIEVTTYNTLVCGVLSNIKITSMEGKVSGKQDSLLHRSQARHARHALANIRRVCVGWSRVVPTLELKFFHETISLLESHGFSEEKVASIRQDLFRPEEEKLTACHCCGLQLSTQLLLPCCGCWICPECMEFTSTNCVVCDNTFDVDDFQRLQPGYVMTWKSNLASPPLKSTFMASPPSQHHQRSHQVLDERAVVHHASHPRRRNRQTKDHVCDYDYSAGDGVCKECKQAHDGCTLFNPDMRCPVCHRIAQECPPDESKARFLVQKLEKLMLQWRNGGSPDNRPPKVIVFSQFRKALDVVGDRLLNRFGSNCVAEYWGRFRTQELHKFTVERDCFCMFLSNDGSEGLDLSFVTHIFFLEEIWDSRLRDQTVARAWRMGATGSVTVETLLAKNSIEETMQDIEPLLRGDKQIERASSSPDGTHSLKEHQEAKTKVLLRSLRLLTDYHYFAQSDSSSLETKTPLLTASENSPTSLKRKLPEGGVQSHDSAKRVRFQ